jgi:ABC-type transport system involved in cytochrome c biogenesis permease subunit
MIPLLLTVLAAYVTAAIHSVLAFVHKRRALERIALMSLGVGFTLHTIALIADWVQDGRYPLFGFRETVSFLAWTFVATYGLTLYRYRTWVLGAFTTPIVCFLTFISIITPITTQAANFSVAAQGGTWLMPVHTTLISFAYASFFVVFITSVMYLLQERELKLKTFSAVFHRLPSLTTVNDIAASATGIGLTLLSIGILSGMVWSSARDGRLWHNDPKEIFAAITWALYLALILYRSSANWHGRRAAWLGVFGFCLVLFTFLGARMMTSYHMFG